MEADEKDQTIAETQFRMVRGQGTDENQDQNVTFGRNLDIDYELSEEQEKALSYLRKKTIPELCGFIEEVGGEGGGDGVILRLLLLVVLPLLLLLSLLLP